MLSMAGFEIGAPGAPTCKTCRYRGEVMFDQDGVDVIRCDFPREMMSLCMQGFAQRERELVRDDAAGCPTYATKE